jgi:ribosomal protein S21
MIKKFQKKVKKERIIEEVRDRKRYKKPSVKKKEKRIRAERTRMREERKRRKAQERRNRKK